MIIAGLGTATPPRAFAQAECWAAVRSSRRFAELSSRSKALLKRVLTGRNGIEYRHLALTQLADAFEMDPDTLHARFREHAPRLAAEAANAALQDGQVDKREVDGLVVSTCTGYLCPGLTSYATEQLGLREDVLALDLVGQGCVAALPNLGTAEALLASKRCGCVLSICVEVCSAAFYLDDNPGVLISACLFGDAAGAAVLRETPGAQRTIRWKSAGALLRPAERDLLRFEQKNGMLRNILAPVVPQLAATSVRTVLERTLEKVGMTRSDITAWILHPGGRDVLRQICAELNLGTEDVRHSAEILRRYGNVSSASLYFVLQAALQAGAPGGHWWLSSFGAGFSCQGALLEVA